MKLSILGGGGFRTPFVWQALLRERAQPRVTEVALHDVDPARLRVMTHVLGQLAAGVDDPPNLTTTTDLRTAVAGSDFVFAALRVGGLAGRQRDEHVALDLGLIGQETTGPGGIAYALRSVPVMLDVARTVAEVAPTAFVMNFTNPAGIVTEAMQSVLGDRVLGICDTPSGLGLRVAAALGHDPQDVQLDYVGLNHLGWLRRVLSGGRDVLPDLLADDVALARTEEGQIFGTDWIHTLGAIPNEYLYYYYRRREALASLTASGTTRGDHLARTQHAFYDAAATDLPGALEHWRTTASERSASYMAEAAGGVPGSATLERPETDPAEQGYAGVALAVMAAVARDERRTMILNVRNAGAVPGLPDDAVVEVPTTVGGDGVRPRPTEPATLHQLGLMQQVKAVERYAIEAASTGSREAALRAFALHPLVDSVDVARRLLDAYVAADPAIAALLRS